MPKYYVLLTVDATIRMEVEADSEEQAKEIAIEEADTPRLCHQCAKEVEIGDVLDAIEAWVKE